MKYRTFRDYYKWFSLSGLLFAGMVITLIIVGFFEEGTDAWSSGDLLELGVEAAAGVWICVYCWRENFKRRRFRKKGQPIPGKVIGAKFRPGGRGILWRHFLMIEFVEDGEKKLFLTKGYVDDPNHVLRNLDCIIYKWKNKYIEADFNLLEEKDRRRSLSIPITRSRFMEHWRKEYV